jgi:hypothetical protein
MFSADLYRFEFANFERTRAVMSIKFSDDVIFNKIKKEK